jgi:hypothetical protein
MTRQKLVSGNQLFTESPRRKSLEDSIALPHRKSCGHSQMLWRELGLPFLDLATRVIRRMPQTFKRLSESKGCCSGGLFTA